MSSRLWYPQLDVYDCVRRIGALLAAYSDPPGLERLCIADFYLANPPLLHQTQMPHPIRVAFRALGIPRPDKTFLTYPAPPLLFKQMEPIQRAAMLAMRGKGLLSLEQSQRGSAQLTEPGALTFRTLLLGNLSSAEALLIRFLTTKLAPRDELGALELRRSTGLKASPW